jgi:hypothetical protein
MGGVIVVAAATFIARGTTFDLGTGLMGGMGLILLLSAVWGPPRWVVTLVVLSLGGGSSAT